jgi:hypothetical protein
LKFDDFESLTKYYMNLWVCKALSGFHLP